VPFELSKMRPGKQVAWCLESRFENLLKIFRADSAATIPSDRRGRKGKLSDKYYLYALRQLKKARSHKSLNKPLISGNDVMRILRIPPGSKIGEVLSQMREMQLAGKIKTKEQALAQLKKM
jgi:hypothetical protein